MAIEFIQAFMQSYPRLAVIIAALLISFFISLVNFFVLDKEKMHEIKGKQKALQEEMKNHKDILKNLWSCRRRCSRTWARP